MEIKGGCGKAYVREHGRSQERRSRAVLGVIRRGESEEMAVDDLGCRIVISLRRAACSWRNLALYVVATEESVMLKWLLAGNAL